MHIQFYSLKLNKKKPFNNISYSFEIQQYCRTSLIFYHFNLNIASQIGVDPDGGTGDTRPSQYLKCKHLLNISNKAQFKTELAINSVTRL